jgi:hypothetical protein
MTRPGSVRGAVAVARLWALAAVALWFQPLEAAADTKTVIDANAPIVHVALRQGDITVRTWDRNAVQIEGDPSLTIERRTTDQSGIPPLLIPEAHQGTGDDALVLAPENFVAAELPAGPHDVVEVHDRPLDPSATGPLPPAFAGGVVVTVPNNAVFVSAKAFHGNLDVHDYRSGTFEGFAASGRLTLTSVGGTVFAQTRRGAIVIQDSSFDRVRARSLLGNITFERCRVRQIEVTTGSGSIVYDDGAFEPGIARFESVRGNVAIGSDGPVQFGAHTATDGHVFTSLSHSTRVAEPGEDGGAQAAIGDGGPVVTATTRAGDVYLYEGSLRRLPGSAVHWPAPLRTLQHPAAPPVQTPRLPYQPPVPPVGPQRGAGHAIPRPAPHYQHYPHERPPEKHGFRY